MAISRTAEGVKFNASRLPANVQQELRSHTHPGLTFCKMYSIRCREIKIYNDLW